MEVTGNASDDYEIDAIDLLYRGQVDGFGGGLGHLEQGALAQGGVSARHRDLIAMT